MMLLSKTITTALTASASAPAQSREGNPESAIIQAVFTYGSGGTTFSLWVQSSLDDGTTWFDIFNLSGTTVSITKMANLSALTPVTTLYTPTNGSLSANTVENGFLGPQFRTLLTTTGTYAGSTSLRVDVAVRGRLTAR
jgi:hypothetical protein